MTAQKTSAEMLHWFENDLLPRLLSQNAFPVPGVDPSNLSISKLKWEITDNSNSDHFASRPFYSRLTLCDSKNEKISKEFSLLVKFIPQNPALRAHMDIETQFYNEMKMFSEVLPAFQKFLENRPNVSPTFLYDIVPRCYYSNINLNDPDYGIVILDDLRKDGYYPAKSVIELDFNHCKLALDRVAKLHALSYAMKLENSKEFETLKDCFIESRYNDDPFKEHTFGTLLEAASLRGIDYLINKDGCEVPKDYLLKLRKIVTSGIYKEMRNLASPKEPLAVLVHGDFCRNNMLFRLNNGEADGCILIDFATCRYASPSFDLCFFLFMNTTLSFREKYFDELLKYYHSTLVETIATILNKTNTDISEKLPFNLILKDFNDLSLTGYCTIAFFLPVMLYPEEFGNIEDEIMSLTPEESAVKNSRLGGEEGSKRMSEPLIDMYRRGAYRDNN